ncbi:MAG TPA: tetratricopeptide repeat protein [Alphaproteobacteria bacterium]|jgi:protein O-GlcNAc transferase|nr:tetratricopeptide repeat protein [Alphaproteobacteria bacterium]
MNQSDIAQQVQAAFEAGIAAHREGRAGEAEVAFRRVLTLVPDHPDALHLLGLALHFQGRSTEGIESIRRAIAVFPGNPAYFNNLGNALNDIGDRTQAEAAFRRATEVRPDYPVAWQALGTMAMAQRRPREALALFGKGLAADPAYAAAENGIGNAHLALGEIEDAVRHYRAALRLDPDDVSAASNALMSMHYDPAATHTDLVEAHRAWGRRLVARLPSRTLPFANHRNPDRRLRIGYVSADFRRHSVAFFIEPVVAAHDRSTVEVTLYADVARPDAVTERLRASADRWRDIHRVADDAVARAIEADGIDVLVDLSGHTSGNRLGVFARRPAPVQASWIGYPGITGLPTIDWRMTDAVADPVEASEGEGPEALFRLPDGFLCYRPPADAPPVTERHDTEPVVFASFNVVAKLSPETIALWSRVLQAVPRARLLLKSDGLDDAGARERITRTFAERGVDAERLELIGFVPDPAAHLATYHKVDIALDPTPYNGTTTTMEALWMGVPAVTLRGDRHSARVGASLLTRAGLGELIAGSGDQLVHIARALAVDRARLAELRSNMRARLTGTTLLDAPRFTRGVEAAYRAMWRRFLAG